MSIDVQNKAHKLLSAVRFLEIHAVYIEIAYPKMLNLKVGIE